ncbi:MAG: hypothetical protein AAFY20_06155 [Cyanobacteria bacterium J06639_14]
MTSLCNLLFLSVLVLHLSAQAQAQIDDEPQADSALDLEPTVAQSSEIAQRSDEEKPDRINYTGIGGTIGLSDGGDTASGEGGFSIVGRFSLTNNLSIHAVSVVSDDSIFSLALS